MLSEPHNDQESDSLIEGTAEVLEREGIDKSVVHCRGIWFRANLRDRTRPRMFISGGGSDIVPPGPSN